MNSFQSVHYPGTGEILCTQATTFIGVDGNERIEE